MLPLHYFPQSQLRMRGKNPAIQDLQSADNGNGTGTNCGSYEPTDDGYALNKEKRDNMY